jgi:probable F420-dependent oxidoreductase
MHEFRFSFNIRGITSRQAFIAECREAEQLGYDAVFMPDHLGNSAPFPALVTAAEATQRLRVGTLVLNVPFWNPALLAREVVTTDILTDGRLDLGLGSGHMKWEFDEAGICWQGPAGRAAALEQMIGDLQRYFSTECAQHGPGRSTPKPVQRAGFGGYGPPLLVGGNSDAVLRIAAQHAQIVGATGAFQIKGQPPGVLRLATMAEADERAAFARACAGARAPEIEWHILVQGVVVTSDRRAAAEELVAEDRRHFEELDASDERAVPTVEDTLETPFLLIGTPDEIADQLRRSRERLGYSYITVHEPCMRALAPVIERIKARPAA